VNPQDLVLAQPSLKGSTSCQSQYYASIEFLSSFRFVATTSFKAARRVYLNQERRNRGYAAPDISCHDIQYRKTGCIMKIPKPQAMEWCRQRFHLEACSRTKRGAQSLKWKKTSHSTSGMVLNVLKVYLDSWKLETDG
jgi:hypothetical protein